MALTAGFTFRLFGSPVRVRSSFFTTAVVLALLAGRDTVSVAIWLGVVFVSVLWHELGHAWAARRFGLESDIELHAMGGVTRHRPHAQGRELRWWQDAAIALAGPAAGLLLGGAVWLAARHAPAAAGGSPVAVEIVRGLRWANVGWSLINLLPVLPYDGGLAFCAALGAMVGRRRAKVAANAVSFVVGGAGCVYAVKLRMLWVAYLAGAAAFRAAGALRRQRAERRLELAWAAVFDGKSAEAARVAADLARPSEDERVRTRAVELLAWCKLHRGDVAGAREATQAMPPSHQPSPELRLTLDLLAGVAAEGAQAAMDGVDLKVLSASWLAMLKSWLGGGPAVAERVERLIAASVARALPRDLLHGVDAVLFHGGEFRAALVAATRTFEAHGAPEDAYNVACSYARLGEPARACEWLERARVAGFRNVDFLRADEDLASLRGQPGFAQVEAAMAADAVAAAAAIAADER